MRRIFSKTDFRLQVVFASIKAFYNVKRFSTFYTGEQNIGLNKDQSDRLKQLPSKF